MTQSGRGILLVILATACWATSGLFIKFVIAGSAISAWGLAFWRDAGTFACLVAGLALFRPHLLRVRWHDLPWLAATGAISIGLFHAVWNMAVLANGAALATALQANAPIFVAVMAWLLWKEPLTWPKIGALGLAILGTLLLSQLSGDQLRGTPMNLFGLMAGLTAAIAYGSFSLFGKKLGGEYEPWTILVYVFGFGALALLPLQIGRAVPWPLSPAVIGSFAGLVLLTTIAGFALYTTALRCLPASVAAITATTEVPLAASLAYLALGERLDGWQLLGSVLVVGGVVLVSWSRRRRPALAPAIARIEGERLAVGPGEGGGWPP